MHPILALSCALYESAPKLRAAGPELGAASPDIGAMTAVIVIFLVCLLATGYGVRRLLGSAWRARAAKRSLSVIDVLPLGGRRQLVVVRCYDRTLALGLGDRDVSLLAELDTELVAAEAAKSVESVTRAKQQFRGLFERASRALNRVDLTTSEPVRVVAPTPPPQARAVPRSDHAEPLQRTHGAHGESPARRVVLSPSRSAPQIGSPLPSDVDEVVA
jgi:flagellar biogenesis protein FliO